MVTRYWGGGWTHASYTPLPYLPGRPTPPPPPTHGLHPGEWIPQREGGQQAQPAPVMGLADLGLSYSTLHNFLAALQGVVAAVFSAAFPFPAPSGPTGKVATLSLLNLRFTCGVTVDVFTSLLFGSRSPGEEERWRG